MTETKNRSLAQADMEEQLRQKPIEKVLPMPYVRQTGPARRVRHPKYGWRLYAGMIRSEAPKLHFDWAPYDLDLPDVVLQAGCNLYLSNFEQGGDLRVYRRCGMSHGNRAGVGVKVIGNYDLPSELVEGGESCTIRCAVGDFVAAPNRFLHEVTPRNEAESKRLVLSFHFGLLSDGQLIVFS